MAAGSGVGEVTLSEEKRIYPLTSGEGFGAIFHGNFVIVRFDWKDSFSISVLAFQSDHNGPYRSFESLDEGLAWAESVAASHKGENRHFEYWEIYKGFTLTLKAVEEGYRTDTFPMWVDTDHDPWLSYVKTFTAKSEAIRAARASIDEQWQMHISAETKREQNLSRIKAALTEHLGHAESVSE